MSDALATRVTEVEVSRPSGIAAALVEAQRKAHAVHKGSKNAFHGYKYASAEALIAESREALTAAGLAVFALGWTVEYLPGVTVTVTKKDGSGMSYTQSKVIVRYRLFHESGETMDFMATETSVVPEAGRPQDKAEATALTYNLGYFLRALLNLPRVEEEPDQRDDRGSAPAPVVQAPPKRDWDAFTDDIVGKLGDAKDDAQVTMIAKSVHEAKPPKAHRDRIAQVYAAKIAALKGGANGAQASHGQ